MNNIGPVPEYPDIKTYMNFSRKGFIIWDGDPWKEATMSWKESCYIHAGLSGAAITFEGKDAQDAISRSAINNVYKWKIGMSKHLVQCNEDGLIVNHGLMLREGEEKFRLMASAPFSIFRQIKEGMDVKVSAREMYIFQIAGPLSLTAIEKASGELHRDLKFLGTKMTRIAGIDVELSRIGMSGTLAYEVRGDMKDGPSVYDALYQAGKPLGMKRLGWNTYFVNHTEGGFPQMTGTFTFAEMLNEEYEVNPLELYDSLKMSGSIDPKDLRARMRTPGELGWNWMAKFDHDFVGREAVEAEYNDPKRTIVMLEYNAEDVLDTYASLFREGEDYQTFGLPLGTEPGAGGHADLVTNKEGKAIGVASNPVYSYYYRKMIAHCTIDIDQAEIGNEVIVHWGEYGHKIKEIRATVARFPYIDLPSNQEYDLDTVPKGV